MKKIFKISIAIIAFIALLILSIFTENFSKIATPFLIFVFAFLFLRETEQIKSSVSKISDYSIKWANEFFVAYKNFLNDSEDIINLLHELQYAERNREQGKEILKSFLRSNQSIKKSSLHMSIIVSSFPEIKDLKNEFILHSDNVLKAFDNIIKTKQGNTDEIKIMLVSFSKSARKIHSKLIEI